MSSNTEKKVALLIFMLIVFSITSTFLVFILFAKSVGDGRCGQFTSLNSPIKYQHFATKTHYETARQTLKQLRSGAETDVGSSLLGQFSKQSLEELHETLRIQSCTPVVFYFVGRHAARTCDDDEANKYNNLTAKLQRFVDQNVTECKEYFYDFIKWKSPLNPHQNEIITNIGYDEERSIAERFANLYPRLLDNTANMTILTTDKIRTVQTAAIFLSALGLQQEYEKCQVPVVNISAPDYNDSSLKADSCIQSMSNLHKSSNLQFTEQCHKIRNKLFQKQDSVNTLGRNKFRNQILEQIRERMLRDFELDVTKDEVKSLYKICEFERSLVNPAYSKWCSLFSDQQLRELDYISDLDHYLKYGHGGPMKQERAACPLLRDVLEKATSATKHSSSSTRNTVLAFTHSQDIMGLLRALELFKDDKSYGDVENDPKFVQERSWRASLISPFSANIAFTTYRCSSGGNTTFKQVVSVSEVPLIMNGCTEPACDFSTFANSLNWVPGCDLQKLCKEVE